MHRTIALFAALLALPAAAQLTPRQYYRTQDVQRATILDAAPVRWYNGEPVELSLAMTRGAAAYTNANGQIAAWVWAGAYDTNQYLLATGSVSAAAIALSAGESRTALPSATNGWTWVEIWQAPVGATTNIIGVVWRARLETMARYPTSDATWTNTPLLFRVDALSNEAALRLAGDTAGSNYAAAVAATTAGATNAAHVAASDPHGDRGYADSADAASLVVARTFIGATSVLDRAYADAAAAAVASAASNSLASVRATAVYASNTAYTALQPSDPRYLAALTAMPPINAVCSVGNAITGAMVRINQDNDYRETLRLDGLGKWPAMLWQDTTQEWWYWLYCTDSGFRSISAAGDGRLLSDWNFQIGIDYLSPSGSGAALTGITAEQVGAVPTSDPAYAAAITGIFYNASAAMGTLAQTGRVTWLGSFDADLTNYSRAVFTTLTLSNSDQTGFFSYGNTNGYFQNLIVNLNTGALASADYVAQASDGTESLWYLDMGINGTNGGAVPFTGSHDGYLYTSDGSLKLGASMNNAATAIGQSIGFYVSNSTLPKMTISNSTTTVFSNFFVGAQDVGLGITYLQQGVLALTNANAASRIACQALTNADAAIRISANALTNTVQGAIRASITLTNACIALTNGLAVFSNLIATSTTYFNPIANNTTNTFTSTSKFADFAGVVASNVCFALPANMTANQQFAISACFTGVNQVVTWTNLQLRFTPASAGPVWTNTTGLQTWWTVQCLATNATLGIARTNVIMLQSTGY